MRGSSGAPSADAPPTEPLQPAAARAQVKAALGKGLSVVATCRSSSDELEALDGPLHIMPGLDVTNDSAPEDLVAFLKDKAGWETIDAVISISGLFTFDSLDELQPGKMTKMYEVCAVGPLRILSHLALKGVLPEGGKIGMITSEGGSIGLRTDTEGGGNYGARPPARHLQPEQP